MAAPWRPETARGLILSAFAAVLASVSIAASATPAVYFIDVKSAWVGSFVVLRGRDFGSSGVVRFGGVTASEVVSWSANRIVCRVPSGAGSPVRVENSQGTSNGEPLAIHQGRTLWVAKNGSDSNPGSEAAPFLTIHRASTVAAAGDVVLVRQGTYNEALELDASRSGTQAAPIAYRAYPGQTVTIDGTGKGASTVILMASDVTFSGFAITGASGSGWNVKSPSRRSRLVDCDVYANNVVSPAGNGSGVKISEGTADPDVIGNRIHDNGSSSLDHGFYVKGDRMLIAHNEVYDNYGYGIQVYGDNGVPFQDANVHSNVVYGNGKSGILVGTGSVGARVVNNLCYDNRQRGIDVSYGPQDTHVVNNTVHGNGDGSYYQLSIRDSSQTLLRNNIVTGPSGQMLLVDASAGGVNIDFNHYGSGASGSFNWKGSLYTYAGYRSASGQDAHSAVGDPLYADTGANGFHLQKGSPARDVAEGATAPAEDRERNARPWGTGDDRGASEYVESTSDVVPPAAPSGLVRKDVRS